MQLASANTKKSSLVLKFCTSTLNVALDKLTTVSVQS